MSVYLFLSIYHLSLYLFVCLSICRLSGYLSIHKLMFWSPLSILMDSEQRDFILHIVTYQFLILHFYLHVHVAWHFFHRIMKSLQIPTSEIKKRFNESLQIWFQFFVKAVAKLSVFAFEKGCKTIRNVL